MAFANDCLESGYQTLKDVPNLELDQATAGTLKFTINDPRTGASSDLSDYDTSSSSSSEHFSGLKLTLKEMPEDATVWAEAVLDILDAPNGVVSFDYDEIFTRRAGVFTAQVEFWHDGAITRVLPYFVTINPNLRASSVDRGLGLSAAEIRMTIRDVDPEANYLLEELDFSDQEIALAVRRCIDYWNEVPPPVATYKATNFPWRYHLTLGVAAVLHQMAANQKMRNDLPYQAGGVTVQDTVKFQQYLDFFNRYWQQWVMWVKHKKYELNVAGAYGIAPSGYGYDYFYR